MALEFDEAASERIDLADSADFSPRTGVYTMAARFKTSFDFNAAAHAGYFFGNYGLDVNNFIMFQVAQADNKLLGYYRDGGGDALIVSGQGAVVNDGAIHTALWVRETQTTARLYLDGSSIGIDANVLMGDIDTPGGATPTIGCLRTVAPTFTHHYEGDILEARIYKGKAFSAAEAEIFHEAQGYDNIVDNLVARWPMNENTDGQVAAGASSVIDISPNGHHGTPINTPIYRQAPMSLIRAPLSTGIKTL